MSARHAVVIPTRDRLAYLEASIRSVLGQTAPPDELVLVDNGRRGGSRELASALRHPRLRVVAGDPEGDVIANLDRAFDATQAEFVVVFHDDDVMHPRLLEAELAVFEAHPGLAWVGSAYRQVDDAGAMGSFGDEDATPDLFPDARAFVIDVVRTGRIGFPSIMYRRAVLDARLDPAFSLMADRPFLAELAARHGAACLRGRFLNYRVHPGQVTQNRGLTDEHFLLLLRYYRDAVGRSDAADRRLFLRYSTNGLLDAYQALPRDARRPFVAFVRRAIAEGLIHPLALRRRGLAALARVLRRAWVRAEGG